MILDKLIEKKDLYIYIDLRTIELEEQIKKIPVSVKDPRKRELAKRQLIGRLKELRRIRTLLNQNILKEECKELWNLYKSTEYTET